MPQTSHPETDLAPLASDELHAVDRALRRVHEAMRGFWAAWPIDRRNPTRVSKELGVDRTTCQRVSALVRDPFALAPMLDSMPGPKALRALADAAEQRDAPASAETLSQLRAAVDAFDELLHATAGSLARLKRRAVSPTAEVAAPRPAPPTGASAQESMFHAAHEITRRRAIANASVGIYDARGVRDGELRHVRVSGNYAMVAEPAAVPMVLEAFDGTGGRDDDGWQRTPRLITPMTNANWRHVPVSRTPGFSAQAMEITRSTTPSDVYISTVFPVPDPRTLDRPVEESWYVLYSPTAALVFDLYLHESIARRCLVSLDVHLWQTSFANAPHGKWHTRLPTAPPIVQLGRGVGHAPSSLHPRHEELTGEAFRLADADPEEYIAFRCEERFPVWRSGYRYELDFGTSDR